MTQSSDVAERYLHAAIGNLSIVRHTLASHGELPLRDYVGQLFHFPEATCQDRADLVDVVREYAAPLLGGPIAEQAANHVALAPIVLTANHHGVDFFAQSIQSSLLFALHEPRPRTIPVFACGAVPLNNVTFPRGLLLYRGAQDGSSRLPIKLPIYPDRYKHDLVNSVRGIDETMLDRAEERAQRLFLEGRAAADLEEATKTVLQADYRHPAVLARPSYSEQAVILNHRIWKRLFRDPGHEPDLVYLELEKIAARLLCHDLMNGSSLARCVFFDADVREMLLKNLDGHRGCWDLTALHAHLNPRVESPTANTGTVFFWGVDEQKRRTPLNLDLPGCTALVGVGNHGERIEIPFSAKGLCEALKAGKVFPSLFTSYLAIALARGVTCVGGYYQAEYLPAMQRGVVHAVQRSERQRAFAEKVSQVKTESYLSGMQAVMTLAGAGALAPAGALEIIAGGGLSGEDLANIGDITVREAHLASVVDTVRDVAPEVVDSATWEKQVGVDLKRVLSRRIVLK
ncbi:MAG: hypothetical protein ACE5LB_15175 [Acidiferrobacterales bacterium]